MPAKSKAQRRAAGMAYAAKKGDIPKSKLKGAAKDMADMDDKDLEKYAKTKEDDLPEKVEEGMRELAENLGKNYANNLIKELKEMQRLALIDEGRSMGGSSWLKDRNAQADRVDSMMKGGGAKYTQMHVNGRPDMLDKIEPALKSAGYEILERGDKFILFKPKGNKDLSLADINKVEKALKKADVSLPFTSSVSLR